MKLLYLWMLIGSGALSGAFTVFPVLNGSEAFAKLFMVVFLGLLVLGVWSVAGKGSQS